MCTRIAGGQLHVFARLGVKADYHAKISCDRKQYSVMIPMKALLPPDEHIGRGWKVLWQTCKNAEASQDSNWQFSKCVGGDAIDAARGYVGHQTFLCRLLYHIIYVF